ncbi:unnamed protein product [Kuraishia capsulata CBS 1993]|uniref:Ribosomal protein L9 domain-containing protein n=1 Tax=Kuraishia capsulata CBS 1993 TaxID=1382522 RepID=W6MTJ5_9ASCO|nr:uncharacterized protein KUCA_T00001057001 [Kuraishia capsulata CBS 1993]CDK25090.1 unnamed protein product [Kuraishia capsulata CBS 1993]
MEFLGRRTFLAFTQVRTLKTVRKPKRIEVQLLKDFKNIGKRGEVLSVMPCLMTNKLYKNNGAAYILKGQKPPIPVYTKVEKTATVKAVKPKIKVLQEPAKQAPKVKKFSLEELTGISTEFDYSSKTEQSTESLVDQIRELPSTLFFKVSKAEEAFSLEQISEKIYQFMGHKIPVDAMTLSKVLENEKLEKVDQIASLGRYSLTVKIGSSKPITRVISVSKELETS